jgi:protein-S-isoprenylcysteine O-methyltransferase Ste14
MAGMRSLEFRIAWRMAALPPVVGVLILLPAGTWNFWQVYVFFALIVTLALLAVIYFLRHDRELLERRMQLREREQRQKMLMTVMGISTLAIYMIPGFDRRFGWSDISLYLVLSADLIAVGSYLFMLYVFKVNRFASRTIGVEAAQQVIDTGPYRLVRHPLYTGAMLMFLATPIALGSWWGLVAVAIIPYCLVARIHNEEAVLQRELPGYSDYCRRVRWRLVPGVW